MKKPRNLIIIAIVIVVLIIAGSVAAIMWSNYKTAHTNSANSSGNNSNSSTGKSGAVTPQQAAQQTANNAQKIAYTGGVSAGVKALNDAIQNTTDTSQLFIYYSQLATMLYNNNQLTDALTAAKKAYTLNQVVDSAALVGQIAQAMGDKQTAIQYYQYAIDRIDKGDIYAQSDKSYYQGIIASLGGQ